MRFPNNDCKNRGYDKFKLLRRECWRGTIYERDALTTTFGVVRVFPIAISRVLDAKPRKCWNRSSCWCSPGPLGTW